MNLKPEQLEAHLRKQLAPVYFISGDDPLRVMEAADAVRAAARAQGYDEREVLTVQQGFDWNSLLSEAGNLSLFSQRRIIDLRLPTGKPGKEGAQALRDFAEQSPEDTLLLITAGKLDPNARKSKWVQVLDKAGGLLTQAQFERLWSDLDAALDPRKQAIARRHLPFGRLFGTLQFGEPGVTLTLSQQDRSFRYELEYQWPKSSSRSGGGTMGAGPALPPEYQRFWDEAQAE